MNKSLKPASFLLYLLMPLVFFLVGVYAAIWSGASANQMLASAAIVLGWGFGFGIAALILSIYLARALTHRRIILINWILLIVLIIFVGITQFRYKKRKNEQVKSPESVAIHLASAKFIPVPSEASVTTTEENIGLGFFKPNFYNYPTLNFYGSVNLEKSVLEHLPTDSLVFTQNELGLEVKYAPTWLLPEYMKLDYGIMLFKVRGYGHDFLKIEVNRQNQRLMYVDKMYGSFMPWAEFLLSVNSIELKTPSQQIIHRKPSTQADAINRAYAFLKPIMVENEWVLVNLIDKDFKKQGMGWIQWKENGQLLITYSMLS